MRSRMAQPVTSGSAGGLPAFGVALLLEPAGSRRSRLRLLRQLDTFGSAGQVRCWQYHESV